MEVETLVVDALPERHEVGWEPCRVARAISGSWNGFREAGRVTTAGAASSSPLTPRPTG